MLVKVVEADHAQRSPCGGKRRGGCASIDVRHPRHAVRASRTKHLPVPTEMSFGSAELSVKKGGNDVGPDDELDVRRSISQRRVDARSR